MQVAAGAQQWRFSEAGMREILFASSLDSSRAVCPPRDGVALLDMTAFELVSHLQDDGWRWALWIPKSKRTARSQREHPIPEAYAVGDAKIWYAAGLPARQYLQCLMRAGELRRQGLAGVPHGLDMKSYQRILEGDFSVADIRQAPQMLLPDVEGGPGPGPAAGSTAVVAPLAAAPALLAYLDDSSDSSSSGEDSRHAFDSKRKTISFCLDVVWCQTNVAPNKSGRDLDLEGALEVVIEAAVADVVAVDAAPAGGAAPALAARNDEPPLPPPESDPDAPEPLQHDMSIVPASPAPPPPRPPEEGDILLRGKWGVFSFTPRAAGKQCKFGGWQARCPFHKLSDQSGCKKFIPAAGPTRQDRSDAMQVLLTWCSRAFLNSRQSSHLFDVLHVSDCPPFSVLKLRKIVAAPKYSTIRSDFELNTGVLPLPGSPAYALKYGASGSSGASSSGLAEAATEAARAIAPVEEDVAAGAGSSSASAPAPPAPLVALAAPAPPAPPAAPAAVSAPAPPAPLVALAGTAPASCSTAHESSSSSTSSSSSRSDSSD